MPIQKLIRKQFLPIDRAAAWNFFSSPANLALITPKRMNFRILSGADDKMHVGQIIRYKVTVLPFIRVQWKTEIRDVVAYHSFTDIQLQGPYKSWVHKHTFTEVEGGIEMEDRLEYALPFGVLGTIVDYLVVKQEVRRIFQYRFDILSSMFKQQTRMPERGI
jgi:ligand-binding SRPBCC domain-containing protein